jgi:hypothetical protein
MSTNTSSADYGRFEELAEEFAARFRRGEQPSLKEYIDRCPDLADEIRELFPALVEVERVKEDPPAQPGAVEVGVAIVNGQKPTLGGERLSRNCWLPSAPLVSESAWIAPSNGC